MTSYVVISDLDPIQAPQWHVRVRMNDDPNCLLSKLKSIDEALV